MASCNTIMEVDKVMEFLEIKYSNTIYYMEKDSKI